jgi:hypothetical protein
MEVTEETLKYKTLNVREDEIRHLILQPAKTFNEAIQCHLRLTLLKDEPVYEALSYTWGDLRPQLQYFCTIKFSRYNQSGVCASSCAITRNHKDTMDLCYLHRPVK